MNLFYLLGIAGAVFLLTGFMVRKNKKYGVGSTHYLILNLVGSVLMVIYGWAGEVWPFVLLNSVWAGDSIFSLIKKR